MRNRKDIKYEIVRNLGTVSGENVSCPLELNIIKWGENKETYDLRRWLIREDGSRLPLKGITLSRDEMLSLWNLICTDRDSRMVSFSGI